MAHEPFDFRPSGTIDFEQLEIAAVVQEVNKPTEEALDTDPLSINFERKKDFKPSSIERMLAGPTIDWLVSFAAELRPKALCDRFPHVANRLAKDWRNTARTLQSLQVLAEDARWGTAGYPVQVQSELKRLLERPSNARHSG